MSKLIKRVGFNIAVKQKLQMKVASLLFKTMYFSLIFVHVFDVKNGWQRTQIIKKHPVLYPINITPSLEIWSLTKAPRWLYIKKMLKNAPTQTSSIYCSVYILISIYCCSVYWFSIYWPVYILNLVYITAICRVFFRHLLLMLTNTEKLKYSFGNPVCSPS